MQICLTPSNMAAGVLLIQKAGGMVSDFSGGDEFRSSVNIAAGALKVHEALLKTIAPVRTAQLQK